MDLSAQVVKLFLDKGFKLATAESCTGGLISGLITSVSGSSGMFDCGIVSYSNSVKESILGVKHETLEKYGAVSEQTAIEMAKGVKEISKADICVSVTGIAGPTSDSTDKPVGLIWLCFLTQEKCITKVLHNDFTEDVRNKNRNSAVQTVMQTLIDLLR